MLLFYGVVVSPQMRDEVALLLRLGWSSIMNLRSSFTSSMLRKKLRLSYVDLGNKAQFETMFATKLLLQILDLSEK